MNTNDLIQVLAHSITAPEELSYFHTHEARYAAILSKIHMLQKYTHTDTTPQRITSAEKRIDSPAKSTKRTILPRALDVGCYPYHLGLAMEHMGYEVWGIASNHEPIKNPRVKICNIETDPFPFKQNQFDLVVFTEVLEHLPQAPLAALREMYRVLAPGGYMILTTPNIARSINRAKLLLGKSVTYPLHQILENNGDGSNIYHRHNREYTLSECVDIVKHAHFTIVSAETFVSYTPMRTRAVPDALIVKTGKIVNYALMLLVSSLRDTIMIVAQKPPYKPSP